MTPSVETLLICWNNEIKRKFLNVHEYYLNICACHTKSQYQYLLSKLNGQLKLFKTIQSCIQRDSLASLASLYLKERTPKNACIKIHPVAKYLCSVAIRTTRNKFYFPRGSIFQIELIIKAETVFFLFLKRPAERWS